jgi:two-component system, NtrC family, nitrogen regulation sensor histidine kinase GlnL
LGTHAEAADPDRPPASRRDLKDVLEAVLDGVVVVDREGRVEFVNGEACRMLETSAEFAAGLPLARVAGPEFEAIVRSVLALGRPAVEDDRIVARRFSPDLILDVAAAPLWDDRRTPSGVVLALRDRTIHRSLAERAAERERLSAYGTIASGIAHEVKNPLGGIRGAAEILASRTSDEKSRDAAALIVREVDRIRTLVDDLLVFHQRDALRLASLNIHRVLDEVLELLSMDPLASGVKLERSFDPSIPELLADPDRLTQVFLNLGRNALQALDAASRAQRAEGERSPSSQGTLVVETRMALDHRLPSERGAPVPTVAVTVADDGPGIEPEVFEQLSTPFFTTRVGGTGLGLAVSRHWVARHGGALRLESEPGHGTRARVLLPVGGPELPEVNE